MYIYNFLRGVLLLCLLMMPMMVSPVARVSARATPENSIQFVRYPGHHGSCDALSHHPRSFGTGPAMMAIQSDV